METGAVYQAMLDARTLLDTGASERQGGTSGDRCIAFRVGEELYAIGLGAVREVIVPPQIVPVPGASREMLGVINLRGNVVTVINSRSMLGLPGSPQGPLARILVVEEDSGSVGALVDAVEDIILVDPEELEPVRGADASQRGIQVRGALTVGDQITFVVHAAAIVGAPEHRPGEAGRASRVG